MDEGGRRRRRALPLLGLLAIACSAEPEPPRGLILISLDTLRADALGAYGQTRPSSPSLDRLAARGVLFERVQSTAPWTLPAHVSLLTGRYPHRAGVTRSEHLLPEDVPTLATLLAGAGFRTAAFVNHRLLSARSRLDRGFDGFVYDVEKVSSRQPSPVFQRAIGWLSGLADQRFLLFIHSYDVHSDYRSRAEREAAFTRPYDGPMDGSTAQLHALRSGRLVADAADRQRLRDLYLAGVRQLDAELGAFLREVGRLGVLDDALLLVTSDHGEELFEHGSVLHGRSYFEEVLRVPLLLAGPGLPEGVRVSAPVSLVDVLPTVLARLGVASPPGLDGIDLAPHWSGDAPALERPLLAEADWHNEVPEQLRALRRGDLKLIVDRRSGEAALYDLADDPGETRDVSAARPAETAALREALARFDADAAPDAVVEPLTDEERRALAELGYLEEPGLP